jgi:hypothetical protein
VALNKFKDHANYITNAYLLMATKRNEETQVRRQYRVIQEVLPRLMVHIPRVISCKISL